MTIQISFINLAALNPYYAAIAADRIALQVKDGARRQLKTHAKPTKELCKLVGHYMLWR